MGSASSNLSLLSRKSVQPLGTDSSFIPYPGTQKKKKTSNASKDSRLSIASSGSGDFVQTSALNQPLIFQPHRPNTSAHQDLSST